MHPILLIMWTAFQSFILRDSNNNNNNNNSNDKKTEAFYINVFLKSSECFLDLFLINIGQELKKIHINPKCDKC